MTPRRSRISLSSMRWFALLVLNVGLIMGTLAGEPPRTNTVPQGKVDFEKHVRPILQSKCQPCHFTGGKMYSKLPFDRPATVVTLGEKLFTRIKDENSRAIIRKFQAEHRPR